MRQFRAPIIALAALSTMAAPLSSRAQGAVSAMTQPAQAAKVTLNSGTLTINARNSSLRAILDALAQQSGTRIEGFSIDQRVYGVYGPGKPQEVLASLLDDFGYNFILAGRLENGSPRTVELSQKTAGSGSMAPAAAPMSQAAQEADQVTSEENDDSQPPPPPPPSNAPAQTPPAAQPGADNNSSGARTPQQMLDDMVRMRQQQLQSSQPQ